MAILKHIASKSSNYGAALKYLVFEHDELYKVPVRDEKGNCIMRKEFYIAGLNCEPYSFDAACQQLNREYQKNQNKNEIKSHHYVISFDPADKDECGLTGERAQAIGLEYAKANFPGHQALVCTHMDGHNGSGNIHVHIVINSLRKLDVPQQPFMERPIDCKAGYKHHVTNEYLKHLQKSLMDLCQTVQNIFRWKINGVSNQGIADRLNAEKVPSPAARKLQSGAKLSLHFRKSDEPPWSAKAVDRILHNEVYTGKLVQGKTRRLDYRSKKKMNVPMRD